MTQYEHWDILGTDADGHQWRIPESFTSETEARNQAAPLIGARDVRIIHCVGDARRVLVAWDSDGKEKRHAKQD